MKLTDEEVVRVLAEREGKAWTRNGANEYGLPDYLTSRDALAPVLAGLSEMEWHQLGWKLYPLVSSAHTGWFTSSEATVRFTLRFALTLPPRDLAHAIAEAIKK